MSETVFTKVDYDLNSLIRYISLGEIGLPDIQRPFVWKNNKVRDLFDSMYKGYPVGYFLFWQNAYEKVGDKQIGTDDKQKVPRLVIVDGQQRLTSLYAVVNSVPVVRDNFETENIQIAFNPLEERFEVIDAAIRKDAAFLPDISQLWSADHGLFEVAREYLERLEATREVSPEEQRKIQDRLNKLQRLMTYPFTALELAADISDEDVSDVFVRINSKGTPLNQADFILTLMSVFWDEGRTQLEDFCRDARKPTKGTASSFNYFIEPRPDQLLRASVGVAFKRARLKYVYSILRGKDLETEKFSAERRDQQFDLLKDAQERSLNLQYWHDFMGCLRMAGFRSSKMVSSYNNLIFSYILYLIGRTEYRVEEFELRRTLARWFFMSSVTGRFTGSPESRMEFDLAQLRGVDTPEGFVRVLNRVCEVALTSDFWSVTLPNDLATSSPRSPSLYAYNAALVLLDARALFSMTKISDLMDPSVNANRSAVERHHLFPKAHLATLGLTSTRDTNQIANYAFVEWKDNSDASSKPPSEYLPPMLERFTTSEIKEMYSDHALFLGWENMEYADFLEKRRELIADVIRRGYETLVRDRSEDDASVTIDLQALLDTGESEAIEFKSTLRTNLHTRNVDPRMEFAVLKTLAGFLNTRGGTLVVGVSDDGSPVGIGQDGFPNEDKMSLHLFNIIKSRLGTNVSTLVHAHFDYHEDERVMMVECEPSPSPVFLKDGNSEKFFIRTGPSSTELLASETQEYIRQRF
ncbi:MAG: DUF262 domain-containing protein [Acidobacteria bacterium]|nr:MAG: DUF262 domain-containing protein [Acidobacteriota bacterium]REK01666.1 MAG: DUF262 domain-containing protein [Acidobacteriota bacterium]REK14622.1 MAG: DUF262 domain-containing protein [Acidobacteriota bacterium]REK45337.1 MAG: DUF262 domain-containing protein [Acidobacteriota bacterium]